MHMIGCIAFSPWCCCTQEDSTILYVAFEAQTAVEIGRGLASTKTTFAVHLLLNNVGARSLELLRALHLNSCFVCFGHA